MSWSSAAASVGCTRPARWRAATSACLLIDRLNYHLFQPLLYQVATAALSPGDIAEPLRAILRKYRTSKSCSARWPASTRPRASSAADGAALDYDFLVLATGRATIRISPIPSGSRWRPGLKSLADALEMRRRILLAFELAERETDAGQTPGAADVRDRRRRTDRGRAGRRDRRDRAAYDDPGLPHVRPAPGARGAAGGRRRGCWPQFPADLSAKAQTGAGTAGRRGAAGRRWPPRSTAESRSRRRRAHPHPYHAVGGRRGGLAARSPAGRRARSERPRRRPARPDRGGPSRDLRGRRSGAVSLDADGKQLPGIAPVAIQQGLARGRQHLARPAGPAARARFITSIGARWPPSAARRRWRRCAALHCRASRVDGLAGRAHLLPDRLREPRAGAGPVGVRRT